MYKRHLNQMHLLDASESFGGIELDNENEWVKLASEIMVYLSVLTLSMQKMLRLLLRTLFKFLLHSQELSLVQ